jgi:predicted aldo/keto reductase-like oxidoreductase
VMEALKGSLLTNPSSRVRSVFKDADLNVSLASWWIRYAVSQENIVTVLNGMSAINQMRNNVSYMADFQPLHFQVEVIRCLIAPPQYPHSQSA